MATAGHTASDVAGDQRGVGLLIAENEQPVRLRSFYLSDEDLDTLAARARNGAWHRRGPLRSLRGHRDRHQREKT